MLDVSQQILSDLTVHMKYAKFLPGKERRETWEELVTRNKEMHAKKYPLLVDEIDAAYQFVLDKKVLPSMRSLQFGGKPIEMSPNRIYNCAYLPIDHIDSFSEVMFLLLGGTGVGYSVQRHHVEELPELRKPNPERKRRYLIGDSIEGWADAIKVLMKSYFGQITSTIDFDYRDIRPKGSQLITSGGKAPGPQPLKDCIHNIKRILDNKTNDTLSPIEVHDIVCHIADAVLAGGIRRAALISLFSADDDEMISCKSGNWWELNPQRGRANNSAALLRHKITEEFFMNLWKRIEASGAGEPGIYLTNDKDWGTNPCCVVGSTKIATADGTLGITMKELADSGDDVNVYTVDEAGSLAIRKMEAPRLIRDNANIYRVKFADGTHIDVDESHKFILRNGKEVTPLELTKGDSLVALTSFNTQLWSNKNSQDYRFINFKGAVKSEHRIIAENEIGRKLASDETVHHINFNALDNSPSNLQVMTIDDHTALHREAMLSKNNAVHRIRNREAWIAKLSSNAKGLNNPNSKYYTTSDISTKIEATLISTKDDLLNTRDLKRVIFNDGYPVHFSSDDFRNTTFVELLNLACAKVFETDLTYSQYFDFIDKSKRTHHPTVFDYSTNSVKVIKLCEATGEPMILNWEDRHTSYVSRSAQVKHMWKLEKDRMITCLLDGHKVRKDRIKELQSSTFNDLQVELGRVPLKNEWKTAMKAKNLSSEISRPCSPFKSYSELVEYSSIINHRVISVEYIGQDSVYSGAVAGTHTFFAIGDSTLDKSGKIKHSFVLNRNCEIALRPYQFCNLCEVNVSNIESQEDFNERAKAAAFIGTLQAGYTNFHYLREVWRRTTEKDGLIGIGMTGIGSGKVLNFNMKVAAKICKEENARVAKLIGINPAARQTTVKPSGTSSLVLGTSSGIHAWHNDYYIRRIRVGKNEAIYSYLAINHPELIEDEFFRPHDTAVISVPQKAPEGAILRVESPIQLLDRVKKIHNEWIKPGHRSGANTHNVSATVSIKPEEWDEVGKWMWENRDAYNGLSVLPFNGGTYTQAPFEDCTKERFEELMATLSNIDLTGVIELNDNTDLSGELACAGGACEITQ